MAWDNNPWDLVLQGFCHLTPFEAIERQDWAWAQPPGMWAPVVLEDSPLLNVSPKPWQYQFDNTQQTQTWLYMGFYTFGFELQQRWCRSVLWDVLCTCVLQDPQVLVACKPTEVTEHVITHQWVKKTLNNFLALCIIHYCYSISGPNVFNPGISNITFHNLDQLQFSTETFSCVLFFASFN